MTGCFPKAAFPLSHYPVPGSGPGVLGTWYIIVESNMSSGLASWEPFLQKHNVAFLITYYMYKNMWDFSLRLWFGMLNIGKETQLGDMWTQPVA